MNEQAVLPEYVKPGPRRAVGARAGDAQADPVARSSKQWAGTAMRACKEHTSVCKEKCSNSQPRSPICAINFQNMLLIRNNCLTLLFRLRTLSICLVLRHCRLTP